MYSVSISKLAENDIEQSFIWWSKNRSAVQAHKWYRSILDAIGTLRSMPDRCPIAEEAPEIHVPVRQLLFGLGHGRPTHRILFRISEDSVVILRVFHAALGEFPTDLGIDD